MVARQVELLAGVADEVLLVGEHPGRTDTGGVAAHPDRVTGLGPIGGLYTALEVARGDLVLVVACDLPFLEVALLERLYTLAESADASWVHTDRGIEPLVACYQRRLRRQVRAAIDAGRLKLADLATELTVAEIDETELARYGDPARLLANVNTPDDYERIQ